MNTLIIPVCFIKYDILHSVQLQFHLNTNMHKSARSCYNYIRLSMNCIELIVH